MTDKKTTINVQSMSFPTILGLVFIILKLIGVIDWSWVWVLAPFWIVIALIALIFAIPFIITLFIAFIAIITKR